MPGSPSTRSSAGPVHLRLCGVAAWVSVRGEPLHLKCSVRSPLPAISASLDKVAETLSKPLQVDKGDLAEIMKGNRGFPVEIVQPKGTGAGKP